MTSPSADLSRRLGDLGGELATIDADQFLCGPDGDPDRIVIDDIFATPLDDVVHEWWSDVRKDHPGIDLGQHLRAILAHTDHQGCAGTRIAYVPAYDPDMLDYRGVLALHVTRDAVDLVGAYVGHNLAVSPSAGGSGIGRALIIERYLQDGMLPSWDADKPGFSCGGHAAHLSAFRALQNAVCETSICLEEVQLEEDMGFS